MGSRCLKALLKAPSPERSVSLGREFAEALDLVSPRARAALALLGPLASASVAMLGDSVFAVESAVSSAKARRLFPNAYVGATRTSGQGARLL